MLFPLKMYQKLQEPIRLIIIFNLDSAFLVIKYLFIKLNRNNNDKMKVNQLQYIAIFFGGL